MLLTLGQRVVAARMKWKTLRQPQHRFADAAHNTVPSYGEKRVVGTGRIKPAGRTCERRDESLVETNEPDGNTSRYPVGTIDKGHWSVPDKPLRSLTLQHPAGR